MKEALSSQIEDERTQAGPCPGAQVQVLSGARDQRYGRGRRLGASTKVAGS